METIEIRELNAEDLFFLTENLAPLMSEIFSEVTDNMTETQAGKLMLTKVATAFPNEIRKIIMHFTGMNEDELNKQKFSYPLVFVRAFIAKQEVKDFLQDIRAMLTP